MNQLQIIQINPYDHIDQVLSLLKQLNPEMSGHTITSRLKKMIDLASYTCFGLFDQHQLIGISSAWSTVRIYCGKHIELDNVIIDSNIQSKGYGQYFIDAIKEWALANQYESIGLNTYVQNSRSHKFYYNQGFQVVGFHFEHALNKEL